MQIIVDFCYMTDYMLLTFAILSENVIRELVETTFMGWNGCFFFVYFSVSYLFCSVSLGFAKNSRVTTHTHDQENHICDEAAFVIKLENDAVKKREYSVKGFVR